MSHVVELRDVIESDLPILFEHQADPVASEMAAFASRERDAFLAHWAKILVDESNITKTVLCDGEVAGTVMSFIVEGKREVGYWIGREHWGKGIATMAVAELLRFVVTRPLYGHVAKHNIRSRRVLEKCGFTPVGEEGNELVLILR